MPKNLNKNITLEDLAVMMAKGFDDIGGRMATKADLKDAVRYLEQRIARLEFKVDELRDMLNHLEEVDILDLQKRVKDLEQEVKQFKKQAGFK